MPLHPTLQLMLDKAAALPAMITLPIEQIRATDATRHEPRLPVLGRADRCLDPGDGQRLRLAEGNRPTRRTP
jgi:hypothetical protein